MLLHVLGPRSGYTRGKGSGYGGSAKEKLQQEQQQNIRKQDDQITHLQSELEESQNQITHLQSELEGSQNQITHLQNELNLNKKQMEEYKEASEKKMEEYKAQQECTMSNMEKRLMQMIKTNNRSNPKARQFRNKSCSQETFDESAEEFTEFLSFVLLEEPATFTQRVAFRTRRALVY